MISARKLAILHTSTMRMEAAWTPWNVGNFAHIHPALQLRNRINICRQGTVSVVKWSEYYSRRYQMFRVMDLKRGPLSLVSTIEELHERKSSGSGLQSREYGRRNPSRWPRGTLNPQKLALTSPTSGGLSVGIVRLRTQATEFIFFFSLDMLSNFSSYLLSQSHGSPVKSLRPSFLCLCAWHNSKLGKRISMGFCTR
jgi:hypothetical protein